MLDEKVIGQAAEEALTELGLSARRFDIEPVLGAADGDAARQIRLFDSDGTDKSTVVDFRDKNGSVNIYFDEIKEKIRKQLEVLLAVSETLDAGD